MDLSRAVYSRDLKIATMRALDSGSSTGEIARKYQLSPRLLERWRGEWRANGESAFPGVGRQGGNLAALDEALRIAELERKIGQLSMNNTRRTAIPRRPSASHRAVPSPAEWLGAARANGRSQPGSVRPSRTARSRLGLSRRLAGFL